MSEPRVVMDELLTTHTEVSKPREQQPTSQPQIAKLGTRINLPGLRQVVGEAIDAKREIEPVVPFRELFRPGYHCKAFEGQVVQEYHFHKISLEMQQPPEETVNEFHRTTQDQRRISYVLNVIQQPYQARACGSGSKSSNDRRPVDPPPVVELKVYINGIESTMTYDATFMIYASLETARTIHNGKLHTPNTIPVLAGVTVASAAYLEKPKRAAYFIFPDLSVRHEGWYRLRFSLFEGVKHDADADLGKPFVRPMRDPDNLSAPVRHEGVFNRMDVVSTPFQVFSAKKFPGLQQSTSLSVMVAEQGCRVRIRRDTRQRKRPQKAEPEGDDARSSYHGTPQAAYQTVDHSRTASRNSLSSQYDRRESLDSQFGRPNVLSRHMSSSSLPMASPLPVTTPTSSMPPPSAYGQSSMPRNFFDIARPAPFPPSFPTGQPPMLVSGFSNPLPSMMLPNPEPIPYGAILPPLQTNNLVETKRTSYVPRYDLPASAPTKRSFNNNDYAEQAPLKSGDRPDTVAFSAPELPTGEQEIEADDENSTSDDYDLQAMMNGPLSYRRANGLTTIKTYLPDPRQPHLSGFRSVYASDPRIHHSSNSSPRD